MHCRGPVRARPFRRGGRTRLQGRRGESRQQDRDLRRGEGRGAQLALGRSAVLPADRKAHGTAVLRGGHRLQTGATPDVPRQRRQHRTQQAGHPVAAQGGHAPAHDRQRAWARRNPTQAGIAGSELHRSVPNALPRGLRTPPDGRRPRQSDAVHASRRSRGRLGLGRANPGRLAAVRARPPPLPSRHRRSHATTLIERDGRTWHEGATQ